MVPLARTYWQGVLIDEARCLPQYLDLAVSGSPQALPDLADGYLRWVGAAQRFVNAHFFGGAVAEGLMKDSGGALYNSRLISGRPALYIENGVASISPVESIDRARLAQVAVGGGPLLLSGGQPTSLASLVAAGQLQDVQYTTRRERNIAGIMPDGTIWQACTDPLTLIECQQLGVQRGVKDLMNLDGGGSMGVYEGASIVFGSASRKIVSSLVMRQLIGVAAEDKPHGPPYTRLSTNFHEMEFYCRCCGLVHVDRRLIDMLERLRVRLGNVPIIINSGSRCVNRNSAPDVKGAADSRHLIGIGRPSDAADIIVPGYTPAQVAAEAERAGADGIHAYTWGVHVDTRGHRARW